MMTKGRSISAAGLSFSTAAVKLHPGRADNDDQAEFRRIEDFYDFIEGAACGFGSSGAVVKVRRRSDGHVRACKVCNINFKTAASNGNSRGHQRTSTFQRESILREVEVTNEIRNRVNVLRESCESQTSDSSLISLCDETFFSSPNHDGSMTVYLVSELMQGADLCTALHERGYYTEEDSRSVMKRLLRALVYLHDVGVTHRDVKLDNILLRSEFDPTDIALSDFGLSAAHTSALPSMSQLCGTPLYVAPEMLKLKPFYGNKVDVWSSGVVLFMLLSGYPPFSGNSRSEILVSICKNDARPNFKDPIWELISTDARDFVSKLLTKDPDNRLSAREALLHPWLARA